jgi:hypothetical protein
MAKHLYRKDTDSFLPSLLKSFFLPGDDHVCFEHTLQVRILRGNKNKNYLPFSNFNIKRTKRLYNFEVEFMNLCNAQTPRIFFHLRLDEVLSHETN